MKYFFLTFLFISSILNGVSQQIIIEYLNTYTILCHKTVDNTVCVGSFNYNGTTQGNSFLTLVNTFLQGTLARWRKKNIVRRFL